MTPKRFCDLKAGDNLYYMYRGYITSYKIVEPFKRMPDGSYRAIVDHEGAFGNRQFIGKSHFKKEESRQIGVYANLEAAERVKAEKYSKLK